MYQIKFPKKVYSGKDSLSQIKEIIEGRRPENIFVLSDPGVAQNGLLDDLLGILAEISASYKTDFEAPKEPSVYDVEAYAKKLEEHRIDMIIAVGGGSVIDMAKILSVAVTNPDLVKDLRAPGAIRNPSIPMVAIPTTSGTGAEATANAIFLYPEEDLKVGIISEFMIPDYVILDVRMTMGLPPALTASTGVDALCHALEAYISTLSNPFCRMFAKEALRLICSSIEKAFLDGKDLKARENMQLGAFYAGLCLTTSSTVAVHALSYPLGGKYHIAHGVSNAMLLPYVMEVNEEVCRKEFTELAPYMLGDISHFKREELPQAVVRYLFELIERLQIPSLNSFGVSPADIPYLTDNAIKVERLLLKNPKELSREEIQGIYERLLTEKGKER